MSRKSRRPAREDILAQRKQRKAAQKELRREQAQQGLIPAVRTTIANHICAFKTVKEERVARNEAVVDQVKIFRASFRTC